uniref:Uncharacterized protein n=1 Tax=Rhipicephalus zambeziensis TaxID=60191 RepID=A0A224Y7K3_9ACAR
MSNRFEVLVSLVFAARTCDTASSQPWHKHLLAPRSAASNGLATDARSDLAAVVGKPALDRFYGRIQCIGHNGNCTQCCSVHSTRNLAKNSQFYSIHTKNRPAPAGTP